ncbi:hypothetical protein [Nostoc sp. NMS9]|uniref:hypothetical protein n=1 Tax=Nostoc sp. NMS9 TaxID=2815393 RepID=UPI0025FB75AE|nr:hypothetical protein [Nostoc sp. NMS9]
MPIGVQLKLNILFKPRFQPEAGNACHCGSAASLEAEPQRRTFPVGDWERDKRDNI